MTNRRGGENTVPGNTVMTDTDNMEDILQEYEALNNTLDMLDGCLDQLEHRNDSLFAKLEDLLQSSKETREELASAAESISDDLLKEEAEDTENVKLDTSDVKEKAGVDSAEGDNSESLEKKIS